MELLLERGYRGITFADAVRGAAGKLMAVTFDDAFHSVLALARPILDRLGVPGTVFVPTDFPDRDAPMSWPGIEEWVGGPHEDELRPISWEGLGSLASGGWEIGSHTRSHPRLTRLSDERLEAELTGSRAECEGRLGLPCRTLAYPYGHRDPRVVEAARGAGYTAAATLPTKIEAAAPLEWPRIGVYRPDGSRSFRLKVSPLIRRSALLAPLGPDHRPAAALAAPRTPAQLGPAVLGHRPERCVHDHTQTHATP